MARGTQMTPVDTAWLRMDRPNKSDWRGPIL
jgi:hypothetical protein